MSLARYWFTRTRLHINRVRECLAIVAAATDYDLTDRSVTHDASKFFEPERTPHIWLTEFHRCRSAEESFAYPDGMELRVREAIRHHITSNRHHPEFHADHRYVLSLNPCCSGRIVFGGRELVDANGNVVRREYLGGPSPYAASYHEAAQFLITGENAAAEQIYRELVDVEPNRPEGTEGPVPATIRFIDECGLLRNENQTERDCISASNRLNC